MSAPCHNCLLVPALQQVHRIVKQALQRYSEDRIGLADYALESGGTYPAFLALPCPGPHNGRSPGTYQVGGGAEQAKLRISRLPNLEPPQGKWQFREVGTYQAPSWAGERLTFKAALGVWVRVKD